MKPKPLDLELKNLRKFAESRIECAEKELAKTEYDNSDWDSIDEITKDKTDAFNLGRNVAMRNLMKILLRIIDETEKEIKQRIKQACEFYLRYVGSPSLFIVENPSFKEEVKSMFLDDYSTTKYGTKIWRLEQYNEWLFKLAFKSVFDGDENATN